MCALCASVCACPQHWHTLALQPIPLAPHALQPPGRPHAHAFSPHQSVNLRPLGPPSPLLPTHLTHHLARPARSLPVPCAIWGHAERCTRSPAARSIVWHTPHHHPTAFACVLYPPFCLLLSHASLSPHTLTPRRRRRTPTPPSAACPRTCSSARTCATPSSPRTPT